MAAEALVGAIGKGGQVVQKPVLGRKRTLSYKTTVVRDGIEVEADVVEESSAQVGALGIVVAAGTAVVVGGTALAVAAGKVKDPRASYRELKDKRAAAKDARDKSLFGFGLFRNPFK